MLQQGTLSAENLQSVIQQLSSKRRSGVLEISGPDRTTLVHFQHGRLIELEDIGQSAVQELAQRFIKSGRLVCEQLEELLSYEDLSQLIETQQNIEHAQALELIVIARRQRFVDWFEGVAARGALPYRFANEVTDFDPSYCRPLSTSQVLIEVATAYEDRARFEEIFLDSLVITKAFEEEEPADVDEAEVLALLDENLTISQLQAASILSRAALQSALLGLFERQVITLEDSELSDDESSKQIAVEVNSTEEPSAFEAPPTPELAETVQAEVLAPMATVAETQHMVEIEEVAAPKVIPEVAPARPRLTERLNAFNARVQQRDWILRLLVNFLLVVGLFVAPYVAWQKMLTVF